MRIYIAGPMRGIPDFNFPAFYEAEQWLSRAYVDQVEDILNPARRDEEMYGANVSNSPTGDLADIPYFDLRDALAFDTNYICRHATHIFMLPGWQNSKGACAERALAEALGLEILGAWK